MGLSFNTVKINSTCRIFLVILCVGIMHISPVSRAWFPVDFYSLKGMYVFRNGVSSSMREKFIIFLLSYVCCTAVSAPVYPRSDCTENIDSYSTTVACLFVA
jgi:hypothetical protein